MNGPLTELQGSANPRAPGLVNFVPAVAYHFCLNLPEKFSQPGVHGLADPCMYLTNPSLHFPLCILVMPRTVVLLYMHYVCVDQTKINVR